MSELRSNGFTVVEIVIVVVVLVVAGLVGYRFFGMKDDSQKSSETNQVVTKDQEVVEKPLGNLEGEIADYSFPGIDIDCHGQFSYRIPDGGWYAHQSDDTYCFASTQKTLPPQGSYYGKDISFTFTTEKTALSLKEWSDKFFADTATGDYPVTNTGSQAVKTNNGNDALLVTGQGGHANVGNDKKTYFFYKKDTLGIMTSWDVSTTDQKLRDWAEKIVRSIN